MRAIAVIPGRPESAGVIELPEPPADNHSPVGTVNVLTVDCHSRGDYVKLAAVLLSPAPFRLRLPPVYSAAWSCGPTLLPALSRKNLK